MHAGAKRAPPLLPEAAHTLASRSGHISERCHPTRRHLALAFAAAGIVFLLAFAARPAVVAAPGTRGISPVTATSAADALRLTPAHGELGVGSQRLPLLAVLPTSRPQSIVLLFHGCSHSAAVWADGVPEREFLRQLLRTLPAPVAVVALTSAANAMSPEYGQCWDVVGWHSSDGAAAAGPKRRDANADVDSVLAVIAALQRRYGTADQAAWSWYVVGASSGGVFASRIAVNRRAVRAIGRPFAALMSFIAPPSRELLHALAAVEAGSAAERADAVAALPRAIAFVLMEADGMTWQTRERDARALSSWYDVTDLPAAPVSCAASSTVSPSTWSDACPDVAATRAVDGGGGSGGAGKRQAMRVWVPPWRCGDGDGGAQPAATTVRGHDGRKDGALDALVFARLLPSRLTPRASLAIFAALLSSRAVTCVDADAGSGDAVVSAVCGVGVASGGAKGTCQCGVLTADPRESDAALAVHAVAGRLVRMEAMPLALARAVAPCCSEYCDGGAAATAFARRVAGAALGVEAVGSVASVPPADALRGPLCRSDDVLLDVLDESIGSKPEPAMAAVAWPDLSPQRQVVRWVLEVLNDRWASHEMTVRGVAQAMHALRPC